MNLRKMGLIRRLTVVFLLVFLAVGAPAVGQTIPEKWKSMDTQALKDEGWKLGVKQPFVEGNILRRRFRG
jgi:hypothetical protein